MVKATLNQALGLPVIGTPFVVMIAHFKRSGPRRKFKVGQPHKELQR
jgi:hypothetical protein